MGVCWLVLKLEITLAQSNVFVFVDAMRAPTKLSRFDKKSKLGRTMDIFLMAPSKV